MTGIRGVPSSKGLSQLVRRGMATRRRQVQLRPCTSIHASGNRTTSNLLWRASSAVPVLLRATSSAVKAASACVITDARPARPGCLRIHAFSTRTLSYLISHVVSGFRVLTKGGQVALQASALLGTWHTLSMMPPGRAVILLGLYCSCDQG